ncbi:MAG: hypothetical protein ACE15F_19805 [bacterium]
MSKQQVAMLACRILALYAFMQGVLRFASMGMVPFYLQSPTPGARELIMAMSAAFPSLCMLTFSAALWIFASRIAYYMTMDMPPGEAWNNIQADTVLRMGIVVCGLMLLVNAFTDISGLLIFLMINGLQPMRMGELEVALRPLTESIAFLLKLAIGAWFAARPRQVIRFLRRRMGEDHGA